jgi:ribosomal protein RSM22 (predicted rRNA methylase)
MSNLPEPLRQAIQKETQHVQLRDLQKSRKDLGTRYRDMDKRTSIAEEGGKWMSSVEHRLAYLTSRMPATYAVVLRVFHEIKLRMPGIQVDSLLDLGSGPGTVLWAASEAFEELNKITLVEQDEELIQLGKRLASSGDKKVFSHVDWQKNNVLEIACEPHDLVVLSYVIGELPPEQLSALIQKCWDAARKMVVVIEPGTPLGFKGILAVREQLIDLGAHLIAPCPHKNPCPMAAVGDWCHFSERLERTSEHRFVKEGKLGYEDEKYSYVIGGKVAGEEYKARILRHPQKHSGHIEFLLCTAEGLKKETISRRQGELYKHAKKCGWGDVLLHSE